MVKANIQAIRDNSFIPSGEVFEPTLVEKGLINLDDATGLKIILDNESEVDIEYYYIGEEINQEQFDSLVSNNTPIKELDTKLEYAKTFGINRYGVISQNGSIKDVKPLSPTEHMVRDQQKLFNKFNNALELSTQKILKLVPRKPTKKDDKK